MSKLTDAQLKDRYNINLAAGLGSLSESSREQIKFQQRKRLERVRKIVEAGKEPTADDLRLK